LDSEDLRNDVNAALSNMLSDGTLKKINDSWLVEYVSGGTLYKVLRENSQNIIYITLSLLVLLFASYFANERALNRKLYYQSERARIFEETCSDTLFEYTVARDDLRLSHLVEGELRTIRFPDYMKNREYEKFISPEYCAEFVKYMLGKGFINNKAVFTCIARIDGGDWQWYRFSFSMIASKSRGTPEGIFGRVEDVHQEMIERNLAIHLATTDHLTGLYNREKFMSLMREAMDLGECKPYAVVMLDMDNFKWINDTFGHSAGDETLREIAATLRRVMTPTDIVARFAGDEFLAFMPNVSREEAEARMKRFSQILLELSPQNYTCSIGVIYSEDTERSVEALLKLADRAMYVVKKGTKNSTFVLDETAGEFLPSGVGAMIR
jgi:diguanylate cyclase (GGDEF)-like protein